ncbi:MAG TPA: N-acetylmuramoyl-L-alanine amidase [Acidobacteriaceae bacterium]|nr:N-acetylmuramoyl-L-alanine amidase [Acidobacteriaceae bacterium]
MRWIETALALALAGGVAQTAPSPRATGAAAPSPPRQGSLPGVAQQLPTMPTPVQPRVRPQFVVVLDAAHGGSDTGARLQNGVLEKNITLELERKLRSALGAQGIAVTMTRDADVDLPVLDRAQTANHAQAAACVVIHATATGSGVHLFTSSLSPAAPTPVLPWQTAQAAHVTQSLRLESEIDAALAHAAVPVTLGRASVQPMDSLACPAVAVELAPLVGGNTTTAQAISDEKYENLVVGALAAALGSWRDDWKN